MSDLDAVKSGRRHAEVRKALIEIEGLAQDGQTKVSEEFDGSFETIATLAEDLNQSIDEGDIVLEGDRGG